MSLWEEIINLFFPPACLCCGELIDPSTHFCYECQKAWNAWTAHRCPKCGLPAPICSCPPRNRRDKPTDRIFYAFFYDSHDEECTANRMIYALKQERDRRLTTFLASYMARAILSSARAQGLDLSTYKITYPPRAARSIRTYGFDHTYLLAKALGKELSLPVVRTFERRGNRVQKTLNAKERHQNALHAYRLTRSAPVGGKRFILLDDVITSGATLSACEALLYRAGAEDVLLCALAKDI